MIKIQMDKYHLNIDDKLESQDLIRIGKKPEYGFDNYFLIKVFDYNENLLFEKVIGYESSKPKVCFFQNIKGFIIISEKDAIIWQEHSIDQKIIGVTPILEIVSYMDYYFIIYENEVKQFSKTFQELSSNSFNDLLKDYKIEKDRIKIETFDSGIFYVNFSENGNIN